MIRMKGCSFRAEQQYVGWIKRYIFFHNKQHPRDLRFAQVEEYLSYLATKHLVESSTHNQALAVLLFLYRHVSKIELPWLINIVRSKRPQRLPVVLTRAAVRSVLAHLDGDAYLVASLLNRNGRRLMEALRLRVQDIDFSRSQIIVPCGKGGKDRSTMLPTTLVEPLTAHLVRARARHLIAVERGFGGVELAGALARKYPSAHLGWIWQYVFPSRKPAIDLRTGERQRQYLLSRYVQNHVYGAIRPAQVSKLAPCHMFR